MSFDSTMRSELDAIVRKLLARDETEVSLDVIGEAIGAERITQEEVEQLFLALEHAGKQLVGGTLRVRRNLPVVLDQARRLKREQNSTPNVTAIAEASGLAVSEVRAALLYASVLGR